VSWDIGLPLNKKKIIKQCKKSFDFWTTWLGLRWWHVDAVYCADWKSVSSEFGDENVVGRCYADWKYLKATIYINVLLMVEQGYNREEIDQVVLHELTHVLVNEMREEGIEHEERVATTLTKAFLWVRDRDD